MSFSYMPFYTGDYYRDTRHLSMLQHGAYRQLLDHCWDQKGPLPLDMTRCYRICGAVSKEEQDAVVSIIQEYFVCLEDGHYNARMQREIERSNAISDKRRDAINTRWKARDSLQRIEAHTSAKQALYKSNTNEPSPSPSPSPSLSLIPKKTVEDSAEAPAPTPPAPFLGDANEAQIPSRAMVAIAVGWELPTSWGTDAEQLGFKSSEILREAEKFRQYWTVGKGSGKRRTLKGWRQSWSNWLSKAETRVRA